MIKALIFDLDNTLMPEASFWDAAFAVVCRGTCEHHRIAIPALQAAVFGAADRMWRASNQFATYDGIGLGTPSWLLSDFAEVPPVLGHLRGTVHDAQYRAWTTGLADIGIHDEHLAVSLADGFRAERASHHQPYPDAASVLDVLRQRYDLAILTNGPGDLQRDKLRAAAWEPVFSTIVISGEFGFGKPARRVFEHTLAELGVSADEAIMVGDSLERDIVPAREAGITAIWVDRSERLAAGSSQLAIASLEQLPAMLERIARV